MKAVLLANTYALTAISECRARENVGCKRYIRRAFWRSHRKDARHVIAEGLEGDNTLDLFDFWREDEALLRDIALINEREAELRSKCAVLYSKYDTVLYSKYDILDQIYEINRELERMHDDREELTQYRMSRGA